MVLPNIALGRGTRTEQSKQEMAPEFALSDATPHAKDQSIVGYSLGSSAERAHPFNRSAIPSTSI